MASLGLHIRVRFMCSITRHQTPSMASCIPLVLASSTLQDTQGSYTKFRLCEGYEHNHHSSKATDGRFLILHGLRYPCFGSMLILDLGLPYFIHVGGLRTEANKPDPAQVGDSKAAIATTIFHPPASQSPFHPRRETPTFQKMVVTQQANDPDPWFRWIKGRRAMPNDPGRLAARSFPSAHWLGIWLSRFSSLAPDALYPSAARPWLRWQGQHVWNADDRCASIWD